VVDVGGKEDTRDVGAVGAEFADGDEGGDIVGLDHAPNEHSALEHIRHERFRYAMETERTRLLPAHNSDPSLATVTLATLTSSSGMS
jgi:hypothetical protein